MTPIDKLVQYIRRRHETNQSFENLVESLKQEEKRQMIGFYKWMLTVDTVDNAEEYFHFSDEDMLEVYLKKVNERSKLAESIKEELKAPICEYSGLRPVEGYKENNK